jgi:hypothetical protein
MQELSRVTPPAIRLASIDFKRRDGDMAVTVSGYAFQDGSDAQNTDLESLIEELRSSPLFDDVVLGNVRMQSIHDVPGHRFEATFVAVSVPRQDAVGKHLASGEGGASG